MFYDCSIFATTKPKALSRCLFPCFASDHSPLRNTFFFLMNCSGIPTNKCEYLLSDRPCMRESFVASDCHAVFGSGSQEKDWVWTELQPMHACPSSVNDLGLNARRRFVHLPYLVRQCSMANSFSNP